MVRLTKPLLSLYFMLFVGFIMAQTAAAQSADKASDIQKWNQYQAEKKSEVLAGVLELAVPVLGNAYAGQAMKRVLPGIVRVGGWVIMVASSVDDYDDYYGENANKVLLGAAISTAGAVWGTVRAYQPRRLPTLRCARAWVSL